RTKRGADRLVKRLAGHGVDAVAMHGNKSQRQRESALSRFESGSVDTLVATDVAARGIDVAGISHVINFDPPEDHEGYVHRVGRTARAGRTGIAITLVEGHERADVSRLAGALSIDHGLGGALHGAGQSRNGAPSRGKGSARPPREHRGPGGAGRSNTSGNRRRRRQSQRSRAGTQPAG
ncbi:MAG: helicase-related protein, partial [Solirubrobacteraceae bacterium]